MPADPGTMDLRVCNCRHWVSQRRILSWVWQVALHTECHGGPYGPMGSLQIRGAEAPLPGKAHRETHASLV